MNEYKISVEYVCDGYAEESLSEWNRCKSKLLSQLKTHCDNGLILSKGDLIVVNMPEPQDIGVFIYFYKEVYEHSIVYFFDYNNQ